MSKILTSNIEIDFAQKVWKSDQIKLESFDEQRIGKPKTTARLASISFLLSVLHGCKLHSPNSSKVQCGNNHPMPWSRKMKDV